MRITLIGPGIMPIPPTGWGACEILIWDTKLALEALGHEVQIINTKDARQIFEADFTIWMDTIKESNYKDTDLIFQEPENINLRISKWNEYSPKEIAKVIKNV